MLGFWAFGHRVLGYWALEVSLRFRGVLEGFSKVP